MNLEEEIERAFNEWWNAPHPDDGSDLDISAYIMPLVKRAQAEAEARALDSAAEVINRDFQALPSWDATYKAGERTEDWEKGCTRTLVDTIDWLRARAASIRADRIESEVPDA